VSTLLPRSLWFGHISPEGQRRIAEGEEIIRRRRAEAQHNPILERRTAVAERVTFLQINPDGTSESETEQTGEVNCARCQRIGDFNAEHQRGWCMWLRHMVSTWHPCKCKAFEAST
jgi:hypothetical protein